MEIPKVKYLNRSTMVRLVLSSIVLFKAYQETGKYTILVLISTTIMVEVLAFVIRGLLNDRLQAMNAYADSLLKIARSGRI